jgi:hypothetical protein
VSELIGKTVLIGVTCIGASGAEIDRFQTFGTVETVGREWISVRREGLAEPFGLPPLPELFEPARTEPVAAPASGTQVDSAAPASGTGDAGPDYTVSLTVTVADAESLLEIRGLGFMPE